MPAPSPRSPLRVLAAVALSGALAAVSMACPVIRIRVPDPSPEPLSRAPELAGVAESGLRRLVEAAEAHPAVRPVEVVRQRPGHVFELRLVVDRSALARRPRD